MNKKCAHICNNLVCYNLNAKQSFFLILETLGSCLGVTHGRERVKEYRGYFDPYFTSKAAGALHVVIGHTVDEWMMSLPLDVPVDLKTSAIIDIPIVVSMV